MERKFHETRFYRVAPVSTNPASTNMVLSCVGEHVLGMLRDY